LIKEITMSRFEKAAEFGAMMGKVAAVPSPGESRLIGGAYGALLGGLGTAGYDLLRGNKKNRLRRALMGAGLGGVAGVGLGQVASLMNKDPDRPLNEMQLKDKLDQPSGLDPDREFDSDPSAAYPTKPEDPKLMGEYMAAKNLRDYPRMLHPSSLVGNGAMFSVKGFNDWNNNHGDIHAGRLLKGRQFEPSGLLSQVREEEGIRAAQALGLGLANTALKGYVPPEPEAPLYGNQSGVFNRHKPYPTNK
jgi:hypothetical protein